MTRPDLNALIREVQDAARRARQLARDAGNDVAMSSAGHFEQGAADAYRSKNAEHLQNNLTALLTLVRELQDRQNRPD